MRYRFVIVAIVASQLQISSAFAAGSTRAQIDERETTPVKRFVDLCRQVRESKYGNVHFVMTESFESDRKERLHYVTEIKFWARDNQYFRIDTLISASNHPQHETGTRRRMVFTPKGSITLRADSQAEPLTIRNWDSDGEHNLSKVLAFRWFRAAGRIGGVEADLCIGGLASLDQPEKAIREYLERCTLLGLAFSKDTSHLECSWRDQGEPYSRMFSTVCDVQHGVVLHTVTREVTQKIRRWLPIQKRRSMISAASAAFLLANFRRTTNLMAKPNMPTKHNWSIGNLCRWGFFPLKVKA